MLTITPAASAAIVELLRSPAVPDGAAVRLMRGEDEAGEAGIGIALVDQPSPADEVIETASGVEVFVEPAAAELLDDQELDAEVDAERIAFSFHPQPLNGGGPQDPTA